MAIKILNASTIRNLHSGQVIVDIESIVKELIENSLDAHATTIDLVLMNNGLEFIQVKDNGDGIGNEDISCVAKRHYTSKISAFQDLETVQSHGFRGEALNAICAISDKTVIMTRTKKDAIAKQYDVDIDGSVSNEKPVNTIPISGTIITSYKPFYKLPVRRQLAQKNTTSNMKKVRELLTKYALAHPNIRFSSSLLKNTAGGRNDPGSKWDKPVTSSIENTISLLFGPQMSGMTERFIETDTENPSLTVDAVLPKKNSDPSIILKGPDNIYFYCNQRPINYVKSGLKDIVTMIRNRYKEAIGLDIENNKKTPFIYIDIQIPPNEYDVNVEPNKTTVLFHNTKPIFDIIQKILDDNYPKKIDKFFNKPASQMIPVPQKKSNPRVEDRDLLLVNGLESGIEAINKRTTMENWQIDNSSNFMESDLTRTPSTTIKDTRIAATSTSLLKNHLVDNHSSASRIGRTTSSSPLNTPTERTTSSTPFNPPTERTASSSPLNTPTERTTSSSPLNTPTERTTSSSPLNTPTERTTSSSPFNPSTERRTSSSPFNQLLEHTTITPPFNLRTASSSHINPPKTSLVTDSMPPPSVIPKKRAIELEKPDSNHSKVAPKLQRTTLSENSNSELNSMPSQARQTYLTGSSLNVSSQPPVSVQNKPQRNTTLVSNKQTAKPINPKQLHNTFNQSLTVDINLQDIKSTYPQRKEILSESYRIPIQDYLAMNDYDQSRFITNLLKSPPELEKNGLSFYTKGNPSILDKHRNQIFELGVVKLKPLYKDAIINRLAKEHKIICKKMLDRPVQFYLSHQDGISSVLLGLKTKEQLVDDDLHGQKNITYSEIVDENVIYNGFKARWRKDLYSGNLVVQLTGIYSLGLGYGTSDFRELLAMMANTQKGEFVRPKKIISHFKSMAEEMYNNSKKNEEYSLKDIEKGLEALCWDKENTCYELGRSLSNNEVIACNIISSRLPNTS